MTDYKKLYYALFNDISKVIGALQEIQCSAEERYIMEADLLEDEGGE